MTEPDTKNIKALDILLVEDNATDAELCMRALKKHNLANNLVWVKDGAEALAFIFRFNKVAIYTGTFINNPFLTLVPIILASYAVGALVTGRPLALPDEGMALLKEPHLLTTGYYRELWRHAWDVLLPFAIGGMALSVICSLAAYPLTLRLLRRKKGRKDEIKG